VRLKREEIVALGDDPDAIFHSLEMARQSDMLSKFMPAHLFVINPRARILGS